MSNIKSDLPILHHSLFPQIKFEKESGGVLLTSPVDLTKEMKDPELANNIVIQLTIEANKIYEKLLKQDLITFMKKKSEEIYNFVTATGEKELEFIFNKIEKESYNLDIGSKFSSTESLSKIKVNQNLALVGRNNTTLNIQRGLKESKSNTEITSGSTPHHKRSVSVEGSAIIIAYKQRGSIMATSRIIIRDNIEYSAAYSQKLLESVISKIHTEFKSLSKLNDHAFESKPLKKMEYFKNHFLQFTDLLSVCCFQAQVESFLKLKDDIAFDSKEVNKNIIRTVKHYSCGGLITFNLINSLFVLYCMKCEMLVTIDQVMTSKLKFECANCFRAFSSEVRIDNLLIKEISKKDASLSKSTFEFYHCNLFKDQIVGCKQCESQLMLAPDYDLVVCNSCLKVSRNESISYNCADCETEFSTKLKVYDQDEPDVLKEIIKLNLKDKKMAKPTFPRGNLYNIICKCFVGSRDKYYHSSKDNCNGVLYKGEIDGTTITICSKCKMAWYENFMVWSCPKCNLRFTNRNLQETYEAINCVEKRNSYSKLVSSSSLNSTITEENANESSKKLQSVLKKEIADCATKVDKDKIHTISEINSIESDAYNEPDQVKEPYTQPFSLADKEKEKDSCLKKEAKESPKTLKFSDDIAHREDLIPLEKEENKEELPLEKKQLKTLITMNFLETNIIEEEDSDDEAILRTQSNEEYNELKIAKESMEEEDLEIQIVSQSPCITRQNTKKNSSSPSKIKIDASSPYIGKNYHFNGKECDSINLIRLSEEADEEGDFNERKSKINEIRLVGKLNNISGSSANMIPSEIKSQEMHIKYSQPSNNNNSRTNDLTNLNLSKFSSAKKLHNDCSGPSPLKSNYTKSNLILNEKPRATSIIPTRASAFNRSLTGQNLYNIGSNNQSSQKAYFSKDSVSSTKNLNISGQRRPTVVGQDDSELKSKIQRGISISNKYGGSQNININIKIEGLNNIAINNTNNYNTEINTQPTIPINENSNCNIININMFKIIKQIGEGTFAKIYQVEEVQTKRVYALKKFIGHSKEDINALNSEFDLLSKMNHKQILKIYGMTTCKLDHTTYVLYILMESATCDWYREIRNRIEQSKPYKEKELWNILSQLISVFAMLQKEKISHRDIKPQNILIFKGGVFKLCDFGEAKKIKELGQQETIRGSELYMSPTLFTGLTNKIKKVQHNCFKSDVFSLGMSMLLSACLNFDVLYAVRKNSEPIKVKEMIVNCLKSKGYSLKLINLLIHMVAQDEEKRPDFSQLKSSLNIFDS